MKFPEIRACTAIITPFKNGKIDEFGFLKLLDFQMHSGVDSILAVGTTGESPTLSWDEHFKAIKMVKAGCEFFGDVACLAGIGSNNTAEMLNAAKEVSRLGVDAFVVVDPYYNGPSSTEIRCEYLEPLASAHPDILIIPYIIPGRTGCKLEPEDLALLARKHSNVRAVKEVTGDADNLKKIRQFLGNCLEILSGEDKLTYEMCSSSEIRANGVISVISNIAPKAIAQMMADIRLHHWDKAERLHKKLFPLSNIVTLETMEETEYGPKKNKARNPLPIKTAMRILGMPAGPCRQPLGKMTKQGFDKIFDALKQTWEESPEILAPIEEYFDVNIEARLKDEDKFNGLYY